MVEIAKVLSGGKGVTKVLGTDGQEYTLTGDRNWRNNNPGNIRAGSYADRHGAIGSDGAFAVFPTYQTGLAAQTHLQFQSPSYSGKTIAQVASKYAPNSDGNNAALYAARLANAAGVSVNTKLSQLSPQQQQAYIAAQHQIEGFKPGTINGTPATALDAIAAASPVATNSSPYVSAYANSSVAPPPLPVPRPNYPTGGSNTLLPFAGGLTAQPAGAGDSWGPEAGRWGPSNFSNALSSAPQVPVPSQPLSSRSVHTVQIDPFTGNPIGSNSPFVSADHPLSNASAPRSISYNSMAGNVALPPGVVPASVTRDLAAIAGQQMNRSGSPDDRQSQPVAPVPMPSRPQSLNTPVPYVPGPNGYTVANKDPSSLQSSTPLAFGSPVQPQTPATQAITKQIINPAYTQWQASQTPALKAGQAYTAGGSIVTQNQQNAFGGLGNYAVAPKVTAPPPKYITQTVHVPVPLSSFNTVNPASQIVPNIQSGFRSTPIGHIGSLLAGEPIQGGLLGLLFGGGGNPLGNIFGTPSNSVAPSFNANSAAPGSPIEQNTGSHGVAGGSVFTAGQQLPSSMNNRRWAGDGY